MDSWICCSFVIVFFIHNSTSFNFLEAAQHLELFYIVALDQDDNLQNMI